MMRRSILDEMIEAARDTSAVSSKRLLQLWEQLKLQKNPKELIRGYNLVFYHLKEAGEFQAALTFIGELEQIADVLHITPSSTEEWMLEKRIALLIRFERYAEFWQEIRTALETMVSADLIWSIMEVLARCGHSEHAFLAYQAYIACVEVEVFMWEIGVREMSFPNTFAIPSFVRDNFYQGSDEQREQIVQSLIRMVDIYLRTHALSAFPPYTEESEFLRYVAKWLKEQGRIGASVRVSETLQQLSEQWLQNRPGEWRSWLRREEVTPR